jgi:outer membrane protein TolC
MHRIAALLLALTAPLVAGTLTLDRYLADVRAANPELRAATERTAAAEARIAQARAWADPVASLELMRKDTELFGYDEVQVGVTQMLPLSRQRSARTATARAASDLAKAESRVLASDLTIRASRAYFTLATARTELELTRSFRPILAHAADAARARLADGSGDVASVLLAETESAKLQQQEIENLRAIADAESAFNALRHQPPAAPVDALDENPPAATTIPASLEAALKQALAHRPELQAAEAQIALASRQAEQSRAWAPDPELMIKLRHMNGMNRAVTSFDTGIALPLPWANRGKYRAAEREATALRRAAEADAAVLRSRTAEEVRMAWNRLEAARNLVVLHRDTLLPLAERAQAAALTGVADGRTGIVELLMAQKNLREAHTAATAARLDQIQALADLAALTGQNTF